MLAVSLIRGGHITASVQNRQHVQLISVSRSNRQRDGFALLRSGLVCRNSAVFGGTNHHGIGGRGHFIDRNDDLKPAAFISRRIRDADGDILCAGSKSGQSNDVFTSDAIAVRDIPD